MRFSAFAALLSALLALAGCASQAPEPLGPANERVFPASFERVWEAARTAVPSAWGAGVRTADATNGVLTLDPRLIGGRMRRNPSGSALGEPVTQQLTVFVARGGDSGTKVSLRLETSTSDEETPSDERLERKILDAIDKELKK